MKLRIYNTLSGRKEEFIPIRPDKVGMYVCGPTVYSRAHLGNARSAVVFDVLYRTLRWLYPDITYVRNITDVDDKIYRASLELGIDIRELTENTTEMYHEDMCALNVLPVDIEPRATEHIADIIEFIERLIEDGNAYCSNGHVYFNVSSYPGYGKLSKKNADELLAGARVETSPFKRNPLDFVLWKPIDDNFKIGWKSPWGVGRPGWHIECSAMSRKYLGDRFDIHGGGLDLVFPHHENENAQSCAVTRQEVMANYWIHNGYLNVDGGKMSKSIGNFYYVHDLLEHYDGEVIRLSFLMTHYASPMNFGFDILKTAKNILDRWYRAIAENYESLSLEDGPPIREVFVALLDDLNTPKALSILSATIAEINKAHDNKAKLIQLFVRTCRTCLGIMSKDPREYSRGVSDGHLQYIEDQIAARTAAKKNKDYKTADEIRKALQDVGIILEDTENGTKWRQG
ncbi:MAG: cysteine--tRNA ligase [Holosporales bacterium]|jgi:cysteinyl-tRNA synthetase|nr:cysteine--tRNA ligase [Holosporales bacterium]